MRDGFELLRQRPSFMTNIESAPKSPINWILSGVEACKHLIIRTLRLRSVSGFPLN